MGLRNGIQFQNAIKLITVCILFTLWRLYAMRYYEHTYYSMFVKQKLTEHLALDLMFKRLKSLMFH